MSQPTARPWTGTAGTRATAAAAATMAAAVFTVPAAHAVLSAVEDHSATLPLPAVTSDNSPVVHNVIPAALAVPMPRVAPESVDLGTLPGVIPGVLPGAGAAAASGSSTVPGVAGSAVPGVAGVAAGVAAGAVSASGPGVDSKLVSGVIREANASESIQRILAGTSPATGQPHKLAEMITAPAVAAPVVGGPAAPAVGDVAPAALVMPPVPSKGNAALNAAMGAMGTPYRWGGTGRGGFDCSGLAQWAYRKVGISLPRTSRAQSGVGTAVSRADLRPGDLVFFYRPVSHVGIYVGNGNVVHAPQTGDVVKVSPISRMPFAGARRLAG